MQLKIAVPDNHVSPGILGAALETATRANVAALASGKIPTIKSAIRQGVRWRPEPPGTGEALDLAPTVLQRGWGDCDDLAPWLAAELRATGADPGARAIAVRSGPKRWHAVVKRSDGSIDDPSLWAGMRGHVSIDGAPTIVPLAEAKRRALALVPTGRGWSARVDLPSRRHPLHVCAVAHADSPEAALIRAAQSAAYSAPSEAPALDALVSGLCGVADEDPEQMGFLGDIVRTAGRVVSSLPIVGPVAQQVASVARPIVDTAARVAAPIAPIASFFSPAAGIGLQSLPLAQSLLSTLTSGGRSQGPVAQAVPLLPATPLVPGYNAPAASLPLPLDELMRQIAMVSYQPGMAQSPLVARW